MRATGLLWFFPILLLSGCFEYVEVQGGYSQIARGSEVRTRLVEPESIMLGDITAHDIVGMDGEFVRADDSDMVLSAFWLDSAIREVGFPGDGWSVRIPLSNIAKFEIKKLNRWRTVGAVVGLFVASYFGWETLGGGASGENDDGGTGPIK